MGTYVMFGLNLPGMRLVIIGLRSHGENHTYIGNQILLEINRRIHV